MINFNSTFASGELHYNSPKARVVFVNMQGVLCTSDPKEIYSTEMKEGDDNW